MSTIAYRPLAMVNVPHQYYKDGVCNDLQFVPTASTAKLMRKHRMFTKEVNGGIFLFFKYDPSTSEADVPSISEVVFQFAVTLKNQRLLAVTDPTKLPALNAGEILRFRGGSFSGGGTLAPAGVQLRPSIFTELVSIPANPGGPVKVEVQSLDSTVVYSGSEYSSISALSTLPFSIDLSNLDSGYYRILVKKESPVVEYHNQVVLVDDFLAVQRPFAFLEIEMPISAAAAGSYGVPITFDFGTAPGSSTWTYYVVVADGMGAGYSVLDQGSPTISFSSITPTTEKISELTSGLPGTPAVLGFTSASPIPYSETSRHLQLDKSGTVKLEYLPNVKTTNASTEVVVYV